MPREARRQLSNIGGLTGNVAIAFDATIENAVGGSGANSIIANSVSNVLTGGAGSDAFYFKDQCRVER